jgi:hypothetical protein
MAARFRTMAARYPGTCRRCRRPIEPGDPIRYGGRGLTYHLADACAGAPGDEAGDRVSVVRFSSGATFTRNSRGRCEDAPCCGCCTI